MCRLFGFRSIIRSQVHRSLVSADNALGVQSERHPDGWGVAYYVGGAPHLVKSAAAAMSDRLFHRVSGVVASETVIAHIRKATHGNLSPVNSHPFQFGAWIFAHNGNLSEFGERREEFLALVDPSLRRYILGETDSEVLFYLLLTHMERRAPLHQRDFPLDALMEAVQETVHEVTCITGPFSTDGDGPPTDTYLTFLLTNGAVMIGHQGGKRLYYSSWKNRCSDRDVCPSFSPECEAMSQSGFVNHLVLTSEPLHGENVWLPLQPGQVVAVDARMRMRTGGGLLTVI
jgi:predicted glutamine amidotransferase